MFKSEFEEYVPLNPGFELGSAGVYLNADGGVESSTSQSVCYNISMYVYVTRSPRERFYNSCS